MTTGLEVTGAGLERARWMLDRAKFARMADIDRIAGLLHEAGETHHQVFRISDGTDPDWASWYSEWLVNLSELSNLLGCETVRSELTYMLVRLDKQYTDQAPDEPWPRWYATRLADHFTGS